MVTIAKVPSDARYFSNLGNARRALKKVLNVDTTTANSLIFQESLEDGGRWWYSESHIAKLAVEHDKATEVEVTTQAAVPQVAKAPVHNPIQSTKIRCSFQNNVRRPLKGKCADVWAALDEINITRRPTIVDVRALINEKQWNQNNATIEFYAWRKYNGYNTK